MAKIRSQEHLQDALDQDLGWRIKEILTLKTSIGSARSIPQATLVRASVTLLYAHWEGFIKLASTSYAEYVSTRGLKFNELQPCFAVLGLKSKLSLLAVSQKPNISLETLDFILTSMHKNASFSIDNAINTESNLSSIVFKNITTAIGLSDSSYSSYYNLIDESLLGRRNKIAHGEYLDINAKEWRDLADTIVGLMRNYKTDIQNAATLAAYKAH